MALVIGGGGSKMSVDATLNFLTQGCWVIQTAVLMDFQEEIAFKWIIFTYQHKVREVITKKVLSKWHPELWGIVALT